MSPVGIVFGFVAGISSRTSSPDGRGWTTLSTTIYYIVYTVGRTTVRVCVSIILYWILDCLQKPFLKSVICSGNFFFFNLYLNHNRFEKKALDTSIHTYIQYNITVLWFRTWSLYNGCGTIRTMLVPEVLFERLQLSSSPSFARCSYFDVAISPNKRLTFCRGFFPLTTTKFLLYFYYYYYICLWRAFDIMRNPLLRTALPPNSI